MGTYLTRRAMLKGALLAGAGLTLAACQPKVVEVEKVVTQEVEKVVTQEVEKLVKETVVVEKTVEVARAEPVTLQVWSCYLNPERSEPFAVLKERWAEANPNIVIEETPMAGTQEEQQQKIAAAVAAGIPPDLWNMTGPKTWGLRGMVIPVTPFAEAKGNFDPDDWFQAMHDHYIDETTGTLYGLQMETDDRALYWRKDLFAKAGLDPEKPPTTFSEHREVARQLTVKSGDFYETLGFHPTYGQAWIYGYIGQAGGYPILDWSVMPPQWRMNTPQAVTALQHMVDFANDYGGVSVIQSFQEGFQSEAQQPFFTGQLATMINGCWMLQQIDRYAPDLQYGVSHEPIADAGGTKATLSGGWGWAIPVGAFHPSEAYDFMSWVTEYDQMKYWCEICNYVPPRRSVAKDPVFQKGNMAYFSQAMDWSITWPSGPWTKSPGYTLTNAQDDAMLGKKSAQEALDLAQQEAQAVVDEYYAQA